MANDDAEKMLKGKQDSAEITGLHVEGPDIDRLDNHQGPQFFAEIFAKFLGSV